jgi:hypothetical protein
MVIRIVPGIGDIYWLMRKINGMKVDIEICEDNRFRRGIQLFGVMEHSFTSVKYGDFTGKEVLQKADYCPRWENLKDKDIIYLSANKWLDEGNRIEKFLPDLPLLKPTIKLGKSFTDPDSILIYTSSKENTRKSNLWGVDEWHEFINLFPNDQKFTITGATYDFDLMEALIFKNSDRKMKLCFDRKLVDVLASIKTAKCFLSRASGLGILGEAVGGRVYMMYPQKEQPLITSWPDKSSISSNRYFGTINIPPRELYKMLNQYFF